MRRARARTRGVPRRRDGNADAETGIGHLDGYRSAYSLLRTVHVDVTFHPERGHRRRAVDSYGDTSTLERVLERDNFSRYLGEALTEHSPARVF